MEDKGKYFHFVFGTFNMSHLIKTEGKVDAKRLTILKQIETKIGCTLQIPALNTVLAGDQCVLSDFLMMFLGPKPDSRAPATSPDRLGR